MLNKKTAIMFIIIIVSTIGVFSQLLNQKEVIFKEPEIKIQEAIYPKPRNETALAIIEYTIINNNSEPIQLSDIQIISVQGGFEVGSITIEDITIGSNSEVTSWVEIIEDWSMVPTYEPGLTSEYKFNAYIDNIGRLNKNHIIPIPRQIIPIQVVESEPIPGTPNELLDKFYQNIRSGGPPKDGIPPLDNPKYIDVEEADKILEEKDVVFVMEVGERYYIYPQRILVWHEIVNEEIDGVKYSITYCPLTGSAIGYYGELSSQTTSFGTSGKLINSNLVMYDRETDSYWPQILGVSIRGESKGESLQIFKVVWTSWDLAKNNYPDASVLSEDTGFFRSYGQDPYGEYSSSDSYYNKGDPFFPVMHEDQRFEPKEVVVGIKIDGESFSVLKRSVIENKVLNFNMSKHSLVAFYDVELDTVNVFSASYMNGVHRFVKKDNLLIDEDSGSVWRVNGTCTSGEYEGDQLEGVDHFDVMWFGWSAFYPETVVYEDQ